MVGPKSPSSYLASKTPVDAIEQMFDDSHVSTRDQLLVSALHGTALLRAEQHGSIQRAIQSLQQLADGRSDLMAEAAGIIAGTWFADPTTHRGYELIGSGLLIVSADALDFDQLQHWLNVGNARGGAARRPQHRSSSPTWASER